MTKAITFGVVGGYGASGRIVVSELHKSCNGEVLIGGRDLAKGKAFAAEFERGVSAVHLDVLDAHSLDEFCGRCSIVVNCAGPVMVLQDRVAQAAFRAHCHYVDPCGMAIVKERMLPHDREIADLGLSFVVSAGWTPGITEVFPVYTYAQAKSRFDSIESVTVYSSDSGEWSDNALRDGVCFIRHAGLSRPGYFRQGEWVRAKMSQASRKVDLGDPIGLRRFSLFSMPELSEVGRRLPDCDFLAYAYLSGLRNAVAFMLIALFPLSEQSGIRLLRGMFRRNRLPVAGFVVVHAIGRSASRRVALRTRIVFDAGRDYWINGVALATVARMISEGQGVQPGVHFLADAVDPAGFIAELRQAGLELTESLEPCA
jgi:saccharopine dehydrogenase (NAD+, L-lysine forming)